MLHFNLFNIIQLQENRKHYISNFCGLKLKIAKQSKKFNKNLYNNFINHKILPNTILIVEINDCHKETIPGYCKLLSDLNYHVDILTRDCSENIFKILNNVNVFECNEKTFDKITKDFNFKSYERIIYNSKRIYAGIKNINGEGCDISEYLSFVPKGQEENIYVQHHIDKISQTPDDIQIILANPSKHPLLEDYVVNSNYFGTLPVHKKSQTTSFISIGELSNKRRNSNLLVNAVKQLQLRGIKNFKVVIIGEGKVEELPKEIQKYFKILGRVDYPTMFKELNKSDFILPLLDPDIEAHKRYMTDGTSGTFQLVYGFNKPCLIHKTFARIYNFNEENSLIYDDNTKFADTMSQAINLTKENYLNLQKHLQKETEHINKLSLNNLKKILQS